MTVLKISNLKKAFDGIGILDNISLEVNEGEVVAIIGPSGSGKSTLLRCATLLEKMDSGTMTYFNEKVAWKDDDGKTVYLSGKALRDIRGRFGLVFQNFNLFPHYSVFRNIVDAPLHVQKRSRKEVFAHALKLLSKMGLSDKKKAYPFQLSGGQQQRVSIARALAMNPGILFFDEPTSALDPELTGEILKVIRNLAAEKMTMVIVTHEIDFAAQVADRVIFMADGLIVEEGTPQEVIYNPQNERTQQFLRKMQR